MKILYVFNGKKVDNKNLWSGSINRIYNAIKDDYEVIAYSTCGFIDLLQKGVSRVFKLLHFKKTDFLFFNKIKARKLDRYIKHHDVDIIFSMLQHPLIAYLKTQKTIIYMTDATVHLMQDYYFHLNKIDYENNIRLEKICFRKFYIITASNWAKEDMIKFYGANENKVFVLPFFTDIMERKNEITKKDQSSEYNILFSGTDFERKGGKTLLDVAKECYIKKLPYRFTIIGINIKEKIPENVKSLGFFDRNTEDGNNQMINEFMNADIFFLPTKKECAGIVFSEAAHFQLPVLSNNTGGVPTYVKDGYNGILLELNSSVSSYVEALDKIVKNFNFYKDNAIRFDRENLDIKNWKNKFSELINLIDKEKKN